MVRVWTESAGGQNRVCKEEFEIEHLLNKDTPKNTAEREINDAEKGC